MPKGKPRPLGRCRLCLAESLLAEGHIVPAFVVRRLKRGLASPYLRDSVKPARRRQDSYKAYLLCDTCEQLLSRWEKVSAERVFDGLLESPPADVTYPQEFTRFAVSVLWRTTIFIELTKPEPMPPEDAGLIDDAKECWRQNILHGAELRPEHVPHLVRFSSRTQVSILEKPTAPDEEFGRFLDLAISLTLAETADGPFVLCKLPGVVLYAVLARNASESTGDATRLRSGGGCLAVGPYTVPIQLIESIHHAALEVQDARAKVSPKQLERIARTVQRGKSSRKQ